jgi:hypothetical protein
LKKHWDEQCTEASTAPTDDEISVQESARSGVMASVSLTSPTVLQHLEGSAGILILGPDDYIEKLQGELPAGFTVTDKTARPIELLLNTNCHWEKGVRLMDEGPNDTQFNDKRLSLLLKPGDYPNLNVEVGYYSQVIGLGVTPSDVKVHVVGTSVFDSTGNHTNSFWRSIENLEVDGNMNWWVSQGTSLRSLVVNGDLSLSSGGQSGFNGWSSGGFLANSHVKGSINCSNQQQWCSRNTEVTNGWGTWAQIFNFEIGNTGNIDPNSPQLVKEVPLIAEKPRLVYESEELVLHIPATRVNAVGPDFSSVGESQKFAVTEEMLVEPTDTAQVIMDKLSKQGEQNGWKALVMLPGEYDKLDGTVVVDASCNVVVIGLGFATLIGHEFGPCLMTKDTGMEVRVASLLFHQGDGQNTQSLIQLGEDIENDSENQRRMFFYDIFCRTGGPKRNLGSTDVMMQVNAAGVVGDNSWLWTGDHGVANKDGNEYSGENNGKFVDWYANHGLVVEGKDFIQYGLMSEHHKSHMVWFKAENAQIFFYQSELPYAEFDTTKFAYLVDPSVTTHTANTIGAYVIFDQYPLDKSKPVYEAGMSVGSGHGIRVKDLIVMRWHATSADLGAQHVLKAGNEFHGSGSSFGHMNFVSYQDDKPTRSMQPAQHDPTGPVSASGAPWPFSAFCNALSGIECCDTHVDVNLDVPVNAHVGRPAAKWVP